MVELQCLGWNVPTFTFLATLFFAVLGAWGLAQQAREIWRQRSGASVSVVWMSVFFFMFVSFFIYGLERRSLALIIQGCCRVPLYVPLLLGLWRFKGFTRRECAVFLCLLVVLVFLVCVPPVSLKYFFFSYLGLAVTVLQPWEIWRAKKAGVVSLKLLTVYVGSTVFWTLYGLAFRDSTIFITALSYVVVYLVTIWLWLRYRERDALPNLGL